MRWSVENRCCCPALARVTHLFSGLTGKPDPCHLMCIPYTTMDLLPLRRFRCHTGAGFGIRLSLAMMQGCVPVVIQVCCDVS